MCRICADLSSTSYLLYTGRIILLQKISNKLVVEETESGNVFPTFMALIFKVKLFQAIC